MNTFESDSKKSVANKDKHDIDFEKAQILWEDPDVLEVQAKSENEPRYLVIGKIADKHWSAVITYRKENITIISVRRSREAEVVIYEG